MRSILTLILLGLIFNLHSQSLQDFGIIPPPILDSVYNTEVLLTQLNWEEINSFCKANEGYYAYKRERELLTEYEYVKQGRVESFEIVSFRGKVLSFYLDIPASNRVREYFFDKNLYLEYVKARMPDLADSMYISSSEPVDVLRGYYKLLGVDTRDEYGWRCEYGAAGFPPGRRMATFMLIMHKRVDFLKRLMTYSNPQTKLYAIDALIYLDQSSPILNQSEWVKIFQFRDSGISINTCGNMGSYKIYSTPVSELLSSKGIKKILKQYKILNKIGYLK